MRMAMAYKLTAIIAALMLAQSSLGLLLRSQYRDVEWIAATWLGNDSVTLAIALPLLCAGLVLTRRGSTRGLLLWLGLVGYALYNYTYYLFGAALNVFFPIYLAAVISAATALIVALSSIHPSEIAGRFKPATPVRIIGGYFAFVGICLASVWLAIWGAHVFTGRPTPIDPETFKLVAALDSVLMVPALSVGGVLLWQRKASGYVIAAISGVQGSLYLLVLAINSAVAVFRGLAVAPGEIPIWGSLAATTSAATLLLFANVRNHLEV